SEPASHRTTLVPGRRALTFQPEEGAVRLRNVRRGSVGPDVQAVQQGLNTFYGKHLLKDDGIFGHNTDLTVRRFQDEYGMAPADGVVAPITRSALFPYVATTINFWMTRSGGDRRLAFNDISPAHLLLGFALPAPIPLPIPQGLLDALLSNELV